VIFFKLMYVLTQEPSLWANYTLCLSEGCRETFFVT
jgi:hypothetical protein